MINKPTYVAHQLTPNVKLLHKVAVIIESKVLILKRAPNSKTRPKCWDLPGGNSEWPVKINHPTQDLYKLDVAREVWEETGIRAQPDHFSLSSLVYFSTFYEPKKEIYTMICGWKIVYADRSFLEFVGLSDEHTEFKWIEKNELAKYDFGGKKGEFVANIIKEAFETVQ